MLSLGPLFRLSFWFNRTPPPLGSTSARFLFLFFAIMLVFGAIVRMVATHRHEDKYVTEVFNKIGHLGVTMGFLGLIVFFFSAQEIPFLGARFWFLFWGVGFLTWIGFIIYYVVKVIPLERQHEKEQQEALKYLPQSKH